MQERGRYTGARAWGAGLGCPFLTRCLGDVGEPGSVPRVAFSAALSTRRTEPGTVPFDQVLLNDGGAYDPETGERPHSSPCVGQGGLWGGTGATVGAEGAPQTWVNHDPGVC